MSFVVDVVYVVLLPDVIFVAVLSSYFGVAIYNLSKRLLSVLFSHERNASNLDFIKATETRQSKHKG